MHDLIAPIPFDSKTLKELTRLVFEHGVDLMKVAAPDAVKPGIPVYVDATVEPLEAERRMIQAHVRMLFVVEAGSIVGAVDIADLAARAEAVAVSYW